jgi:hypothetical protein
MKRPRRFARARLLAAAGVLAACATPVIGCHQETTLGPADSFLLFAPVEEPAGTPRKTPSGLPVVAPVPLDDARALPLEKQFSAGFLGEVLRTDYLAKQLIRDAVVGGKRYPEAARTAAREPTVLLLSGTAVAPAEGSSGLATRSFFGGEREHPDAAWIAVTGDPSADTALSQTVAGLIGRRTAARVAGVPTPDGIAHPLIEGYGRAMEVIAREWRVGEGPQGALSPDAGTHAQRDLFAAIRENRFAVGPDGAPRPAAELLADPGVAATVIYRLAQSKAVGRRVAPPEVYAPFVTDRIPPGISPAAVLGPFRNFQAKLLSAWGRAVLAGQPPHDIAELVDAYARAMPAERTEAIRIFVVTTYGATVKEGGVKSAGSNAAAALPELTALAAEVAAGRRSSHQALIH